jgi:UDP-N-acetylenolpyruvoylglucosamine reductase
LFHVITKNVSSYLIPKTPEKAEPTVPCLQYEKASWITRGSNEMVNTNQATCFLVLASQLKWNERAINKANVAAKSGEIIFQNVDLVFADRHTPALEFPS